MRIGTRTTTGKVLASVVLVGAAASVAGLGTFGGFTSTTDASLDAASGKVELTSGGGARGVSFAATNLVPGDTVQRSIVLTRAAGSETFGGVTLATSGSTANLLTSDAANGLQLKVDQCSTAWTQVGTTNALDCSGTVTNVVAQRAVIGSGIDLGAATTALNSNAAVSNLRVTLTLPTTAGDGFQSLTNAITFTFDATQRAAEAR